MFILKFTPHWYTQWKKIESKPIAAQLPYTKSRTLLELNKAPVLHGPFIRLLEADIEHINNCLSGDKRFIAIIIMVIHFFFASISNSKSTLYFCT